MRAYEFIIEKDNTYQPPELEVGDKVNVGKFKNRKAEITGFTTDKNNQPILKTNKGNQQLFKPRIMKLVHEDVSPLDYGQSDDLYELITDQQCQTIINTIRTECQPFIQNNQRDLISGHYLYRGIRNSMSPFIVGTGETDRRPKDTPRIWHLAANEYFSKAFRCKYRSEAIFASESRGTANEYGTVYAIFPAGEYKLCFSPRVEDYTSNVAGSGFDVTMSMFDNLTDEQAREIGQQFNLTVHSVDDLRFVLERCHTTPSSILLANPSYFNFASQWVMPQCGYVESKSYSNARSNEVMIKCQKYYGIRYSFSAGIDMPTITAMLHEIVK